MFSCARVDSWSTVHEIPTWPRVERVSASSTVRTISSRARLDDAVAGAGSHAICLITRGDLIVSAPAEDRCSASRVDEDVVASADENVNSGASSSPPRPNTRSLPGPA